MTLLILYKNDSIVTLAVFFYVQIKNSMENAGMIRDSAGNVNKAKTAGIMKNVKKKVRDMDSDARDEASGKIHFRTVRKFAAYIL